MTQESLPDRTAQPRRVFWGSPTAGEAYAVSDARPLPVCSRPFGIGVQEGNIPGFGVVSKYGANEDIDTGSTPEDIWQVGGLWVPPTQGRVHNIASTSANDTSAGSGARTITVQGLDENWELAEEDVTLNGTSNVATTNSYVRIFRMFITSTGSGHINAGNIDATAVTDGTITARIGAGLGQTEIAIYTVPEGKTGWLDRAYASMYRLAGTSGAQADIELRFRYNPDGAAYYERRKAHLGLSVEGSRYVSKEWTYPLQVTARTDVILRVNAVTDNNTRITGGFDMLLVDNPA